MQTTVETILPIFSLVLCGYLLGRRFISEEGIRGLANFVFYVAVPALLFRAMSRVSLPDLQQLSIVLAYIGASLLVFFMAIPLGRLLFATRLEERGIMGMACSFSNTVLLGIPLVVTIYGEAGVLPLMLIITVHSAVLMTLTTVVVELGRGSGQGWRQGFSSAGLAIIANPVILSMLAGLAYGATGLDLPRPVGKFTEILGAAAAPCSLFALGASLAGYRIAGDLKEVLVVTFVKLVIHPIVVALLVLFVFDMDPMWASIAILTAALPAGANVFILARQYDIYLGRAASVVLISTLLSVLSLAVLVAYLGPPG